MSHRHEPSSLKQTNKKHKGKNGRGKRNIKLTQGGKIQKLKLSDTASLINSVSKSNRLNQLNQTRKNKRLELINKKRIGSSFGPPKVIAFISLNDFIETIEFSESFLKFQSNTYVNNSDNVFYVTCHQFKSRFMFINSKSRDIDSNIQLCQSADIIVLITSEQMGGGGELIDEIGSKFLYTLKSTGTTEVVCLFSLTNSITNKHSNDLKSNLLKVLQRDICSNVKIFDNSSNLQTTLFIRHLSDTTLKQLTWRSNRTYIISDSYICKKIESGDINLSSDKSIISMSGYVRGRPMFVHSLMHIPNLGTCRVVSIESANEPYDDHNNAITVAKVIADINRQDSLLMEAIPNNLNGEQTWPHDDEMIHENNDDDIEDDTNKRLPNDRKVPGGMSEYQADWLVDDEGNWQQDDDEEINHDINIDDNITDDDNFNDVQSITSKSTNKAKSVVELDDEDKEFPDEVDTPRDMPARERFARYRALQSFRSSPWHPKENLPDSYSKIYEFENFLGTQKRVLELGTIAERKQNDLILQSILTKKKSSNSWKTSHSAMDLDDNSYDDNNSILDESISNHVNTNSLTLFGIEDYIKSGIFVKVTLEIIKPIEELQEYSKCNNVITSYSLLKHENKLSILHFSIQRTIFYDNPIKSKDELIFQVGFRRYKGKPIFSEGNLNCDKHKSDRFLRDDKFEIASVFGPITYSPSPVLIYKKLDSGLVELVATGTLNSVNPDRIMLKKIILTGYPQRVRKKAAVVKHMFYNPEDALWFKPAELYTKHGLRGHITDTVGTHGIFKAQFSAPIKQNDTVMLVLYKRVFPKIPDEGIIVQ